MRLELLHGLVIIALVVAQAAQRDCRASETVDPMTLLQGIEAARLQIPPSRLRMVVTYKTFLHTTKCDIDVVLDGQRRRFIGEWGNGPRVPIIYDGSAVLHFDGRRSVTIRDRSDQNANYSFDPRLLGITTTYWWSETLAESLPYRENRKIETIGREPIRDTLTWHIRVIDSYKQQIDVWVNELNNFQVLRYDFSIPGLKRNTTFSFFENDDYAWLPSRVQTHYYRTDEHEKATSVRIVSLLEANPNVNLPESTWTLAGLSLPVGVPVVDLRVKRRLGYWNGTALSQDPVGPGSNGVPFDLAVNGESTPDKGIRFTLLLLGNVVVIAVVLVLLLFQRIRGSQARSV